MAEPKKAKGPLTIYDVASRAGVSIASVSRVLNGQGTPRAETREKVMRARLTKKSSIPGCGNWPPSAAGSAIDAC